jgi:hypothetical protein
MAWWRKFLRPKHQQNLTGVEYRVAFRLYSDDGKREVEVRELRNGQAYLIEREWVAGTTFKDRHQGASVGPFASPQAAEEFIIKTSWFRGDDA